MAAIETGSITDTARAFFDALDTGQGWEACSAFCLPDATFAAQAEPDCNLLQGDFAPAHRQAPAQQLWRRAAAPVILAEGRVIFLTVVDSCTLRQLQCVACATFLPVAQIHPCSLPKSTA